MKSKRLVVGNWKMYLGAAESKALAAQLAASSHSLKNTAAWIAPSFPYLSAVSEACAGSQVRVGGQNVCWDAPGAFTGEVSLNSLTECGCSFAIVGHSERRSLCNESSELVARRMDHALRAKFQVIVCVGETFEERQKGETSRVLEAQLAPIVRLLSAEAAPNLCIAYEPVWAIGTGRYPTNAEIEEAHALIAARFTKAVNYAPCILYGGSVTPENFAQILEVPLVHGALVGRASLKFDQFHGLVKISEECGAL